MDTINAAVILSASRPVARYSTVAEVDTFTPITPASHQRNVEVDNLKTEKGSSAAAATVESRTLSTGSISAVTTSLNHPTEPTSSTSISPSSRQPDAGHVGLDTEHESSAAVVTLDIETFSNGSATVASLTHPKDRSSASDTPEASSQLNPLIAEDEFHCFPKLPRKLRNMVWKYALPTNQVRKIVEPSGGGRRTRILFLHLVWKLAPNTCHLASQP